MRLVATALMVATVAAVAIGSSISAGAATSTIPIGVTQTGEATYYNDIGYGACGTSINAATEMLVAVSYTWWTAANPNNDPLCSGISVQVTYLGKTITVPVKDKCPSCDATHIDLSQPAFGEYASTNPSDTPGVLQPLTWKFVSTGTTTPPTTTPSSTVPPTTAPTTTAPTTTPPTTASPTTASPTTTSPTTTASTTTAPTTTSPTTAPPSTCTDAAAWVSTNAYTGGAVVSYGGHKWTAKWWTQGDIPGNNSQGVWTDNGTCSAGGTAPAGPCTATTWVSTTAYPGGALVSYGGRKWTAKWWTQGDIPGNNSQGVWVDNGTC
jgi:chitodextrinase